MAEASTVRVKASLDATRSTRGSKSLMSQYSSMEKHFSETQGQRKQHRRRFSPGSSLMGTRHKLLEDPTTQRVEPQKL